jgi:hypothetical protein
LIRILFYFIEFDIIMLFAGSGDYDESKSQEERKGRERAKK